MILKWMDSVRGRAQGVLMRVSVIGVLVMACAVGSGVAAGAEDAVELVIWHLPKNATNVRDQARLAKLKAFKIKYPNYRIRGSSTLRIQGEAASGTTFMAIAAGRGPDIFFLNAEAVRNYRAQDLIQPLDDFIGGHARETGQPYSGIRAPWRLWQPTYDSGRIWAVPGLYKTVGLIYRRDLFEEVGLNPDKPPEDWDEFYEYTKRLRRPKGELLSDGTSKRNKDQFGFAVSTAGDMFIPWVFAAGGEVVRPGKLCPECSAFTPVSIPVTDFGAHNIQVNDPEQLAERLSERREREERCQQCGEDLKGISSIQWRLVLDEPEGVAALEFYRKLLWDKWEREGREYQGVALFESENAEYLARGDVAMMPFYSYGSLISAVWHMGMSPSQIGIGPIPGAPGHPPAATFDAHYWALSSQVTDPRVRKAAWDYISFMTSDEALEIETRVYVEAGWAILAEPRYLRRFGFEEYLREMPKQWVEGFDALEKNARVVPYCKGIEKVIGLEMSVPVQKVALDRYGLLDIKAELERCSERANTMILSARPPAQMARYRRWARAVFVSLVILAVGAFGFLIVRRLRSERLPAPAPLPGERHIRVHLMAWTFLIPAVGLIIMWQYGPLIAGSLMGFYDYRLVGESRFIGLDNFIEVFAQPMFYKVVLNTLCYVALTLLIGFIAPIALALLLNEVPRCKMLFRVLFYLPAVTTGLVIMFMWKNVLFDTSAQGVLNQVLEFLHLPAQTWLNDPKLAMLCIVIPGAWAGAGAGSLIYLAALKNVPEELYEAADMDGAGIWRKIWCICLPIIRPLVIINLVGATIGAFHAMQNVFVMTGGGPVNSTRTVGLEVWMNAFLFLKFGYATAMAWIMGSFLIMFTLWQLRILKRVRFKAGGR